MKKYALVMALIGATFIACSPKDDAANQRLDLARQLYLAGQYDEAKSEIDSIATLYPKAFDVRKAGLALLDSVRYADDVRIIANSDSLMAINQLAIDSMQKYFTYSINKEYQETGFYLPKETAGSGQLANTTLRSGVAEDGKIYLESVFIGSQKHSRMKVAVAKGETKETGNVTDDGLNYRFSNLGKQFEVIRFSEASDVDIAQLIADNEDKTITVTLLGGGANSFVLTKSLKSAIGKSFRFSLSLLENARLQEAKDKAEFRIKYLENKEEVQQIKRDLKENNETMRHIK